MMLRCQFDALVRVVVGLLLCCCARVGVQCDQLVGPPVPTTPSDDQYVPPELWDFTIHRYPHPWSEHKKCKQPAPSWLCDPNESLRHAEGVSYVNISETVGSLINKTRADKCLVLGVAVVQEMKLLKDKVLYADELVADMRKHGANLLDAWLTSANYSCGALLFVSAIDKKAEIIVKNDYKSKLKSTGNGSLQIGDEGLFAFTWTTIIKEHTGMSGAPLLGSSLQLLSLLLISLALHFM
jgi:hypothetical protein